MSLELIKGRTYEYDSATYGGWVALKYEGPALNLVSEEVFVFTGPDGRALHLRDLSGIRAFRESKGGAA